MSDPNYSNLQSDHGTYITALDTEFKNVFFNI